MEKSSAAASKFVTRLSNLRDARPNELDTQPAGLEGVSYQLLLDVANAMSEQLRAVAKSKWMGAPGATLIDVTISKSISQVSSLALQAKNNGTHWLFQTDFVPQLVDVALRVASLADRRAGTAKSLGKELSKDTITAAGKVLEAGAAIDSLMSMSADAAKIREVLDRDMEDAGSLLAEARASSEEVQKLKVDIEAAHTVSLAKRTEVERLDAEVSSFRTKAEEKSVYFEEKISEFAEEISDSEKVLQESMENLRAALSDVRRQGLAGAFNRRAKLILSEKVAWLILFLAAVITLTFLAIRFAVDFNSLQYEELVVSLLRRIALAAPMIWLGWYAARQVGRLNILQEDYEYKAATALAFESYRKEIDASGDETLKVELLKTTIKNFGDNPVRLLEQNESDSVTPTEELLRKLEDDGTLGVIARLRSIFNRKE